MTHEELVEANKVLRESLEVGASLLRLQWRYIMDWRAMLTASPLNGGEQ